MKAASSALIALLASGQYRYADLYTFTLRTGAVLRYTSADTDITLGGNLFRSGGEVSGYALVEGGRMRSVRGLEVDTTDITIAPGANDQVNGLGLLQAARQGLFDRAGVLKERAFMASWGDTSAGTLIAFSGEVAEVSPSRTGIKLSVKSDIYLLNTNMPRAVYQTSCPHTFGDTGCGFVRSTLAATSTALAGSTAWSILCGLTQAADYFDLGTITFTAGVNAGVSRGVKLSAPGSVTTFSPFPNAPAVGDAFLITPGCDKTYNNAVLQASIPSGLILSASSWTADAGVVFAATNNPLGKVASAPVAGQYSVDGSGNYTFAVADQGSVVVISYQSTTGSPSGCARFANQARFKGCPFIPVPETAT